MEPRARVPEALARPCWIVLQHLESKLYYIANGAVEQLMQSTTLFMFSRQIRWSKRPVHQPSHALWLYVNVALLATSCFVLSLSLTLLRTPNCSPERAWEALNIRCRSTDRRCNALIDPDVAPMTDSLHALGALQTIHGDLEPGREIWSQPPSPAVDKAWLEVTAYGNAWMTSADLLRAGRNLSISVQWPPHAGFGNDAYPVISDVKHRIHCLDRIRKDLYFDYYWKETYPGGNVTRLHQSHTEHCVSILLQGLVCDANTDFLSYGWYEGYDHPFINFDYDRKCGDFTGISNWLQAHEVESADIFDIPKPIGQATLPMSSQLLETLRDPTG